MDLCSRLMTLCMMMCNVLRHILKAYFVLVLERTDNDKDGNGRKYKTIQTKDLNAFLF
jgi:hypothetical protein